MIGHEPITIALPIDRGGHSVVSRHPAFFDNFSMVNPPRTDYRWQRVQQNPVPPGGDRGMGSRLPFPGDMLPPEELTRPEDWPR